MRGMGYGVAIGLMLCATASAEIYKCTDPATGRTTFSQTQCAADAQAVDIHVHRPSEAEAQAARALADRQQAEIDAGIARRREAMRQQDLENQIKATEAARAADLARIKAQRSRAANNLAGAVWLNALSEDATRTEDRYRAELDRLRDAR